MSKTTKIIIGVIIVIIIIGGIWYGVSRKPIEEKVIKIGVILPLSGKVAGPGQDITNAISLALEDINKEKKIIELTYEDSECDAKKAVTAYNSLVNVKGVKIIIGALCSPSTLVIAPLAEKDKVILITPASAAEAISEAGDFIFRNHTKDSDEARTLADFMVEEYKNIAVMYSVSNDSTVQREKYFSEEFQKKGGSINLKLSFTDEHQDFATEIAKIKQIEEEIDAIYVLAPAASNAARIVKQLTELGVQKQIFGDKSWATSEFVDAVGNLSDGIVYTEAEFTRTTNPEFWDRFNKRFNKTPPSWAAQGYDTLMILSQIIFDKNCGVDTTCIKDELYKVKDYPGVAGSTTFDGNGDAIKPITIKTIRNGQFVPYEE